MERQFVLRQGEAESQKIHKDNLSPQNELRCLGIAASRRTEWLNIRQLSGDLSVPWLLALMAILVW
jgi:hypothetical protein